LIYPAYTALQEKTEGNFYGMINRAAVVLFVYFTAVGLMQLLAFGVDLKSDVLINFGQNGGYLIRVSFTLIVISHIPFIFFPAKESMLVIVDETNRRSISNQQIERLTEQSL
jgi:hypothetical protein